MLMRVPCQKELETGRQFHLQREQETKKQTKKHREFFRVKNVVLTRCRRAQPPCVYARIKMITHAR